MNFNQDKTVIDDSALVKAEQFRHNVMRQVASMNARLTYLAIVYALLIVVFVMTHNTLIKMAATIAVFVALGVSLFLSNIKERAYLNLLFANIEDKIKFEKIRTGRRE